MFFEPWHCVRWFNHSFQGNSSTILTSRDCAIKSNCCLLKLALFTPQGTGYKLVIISKGFFVTGIY